MPTKIRRTHYIIKPKLQFKYFFASLLVVLVTAIVVYYVFWSTMVTSPGLEQLSSGEWKAFSRAYNSGFVWIVIILALSAGLESIFLFHRLIGPIYVFERAMKLLGKGDFRVNVHTRKKDELKGFATDIQVMIDNTRTSVENDRKKIATIEKKLDKSDVKGAKKDLKELTSWYKI